VGIDKALEAMRRLTFRRPSANSSRVCRRCLGPQLPYAKLSEENVRIESSRTLFIKYFISAARQTSSGDHHDIPSWDLCFMQEKARWRRSVHDDSPVTSSSYGLRISQP